MTPEMEERLDALERALGYHFKDREMLVTALTHASYRFEHSKVVPSDNQRLEFLGDAVLGLLTAEQVYEGHEGDDEGRLTVLRSLTTSGRALADVARRLGLASCLRVGRGEERSGGRLRQRILADALEAIMGAAWVDGNIEAAKRIFEHVFEAVAPAAGDEQAENPKGALQEWAQRRGRGIPQYEEITRSGSDHAPWYRVRVSLQGGLVAEGEGRNKREATVDAARRMLEQKDAIPE